MLSTSRSPGRFSRISRQRGAVGVGLILLMVSMVLFLAMAVDTGRLYMEKRKLQKQADLAALSLGRSACYIDGINNKDTLETLVKQNLAANGFDTTASNPTIEFGAAQISGNEWEFEPASTTVKSAGRVTISKTVPGSLISQLYNPNDVTLSASAAVYKQTVVDFGVGSTLVDADFTNSNNSLLGAILGNTLNLSAASYDGLVKTKLKLGRLLSVMRENNVLDADLSIGTLDELLNTDITIADIITASIDAIDESQVLAVDAANGLEQILDLPNVDSLNLTLSDIIKLASGADNNMNNEVKKAALASQIALYDLVSAAIYASNKDNFISIPDLNVNPLGIVGLQTALKVIEPPQFNYGILPGSSESDFVASAKTAQVDLYTEATIIPSPSILTDKVNVSVFGLVDLTVDLHTSTIGLKVVAAQAETKLLDATGCNFNSEGVSLLFATKPSVANVYIGDGGLSGDLSDLNVDDPIKIGTEISLKLLGLTLVKESLTINVLASLPIEENDYIEHYVNVNGSEMPFVEKGIGGGLGGALKDGVSNLTLEVSLKPSDGSILSVVTDIVNLLTGSLSPIIKSLIGDIILTVLAPIIDDVLLSQVLGIQVGTADVFVTSIEVDGGGLIE
ncbi:pilus assembly protein TadG-related protein [Photobacterium sp. WH77]|uniref:pilus assembly protein TadG-related protein n=1 Tax=unclassified Photobacterium TaxID=2628852 RepID=UPI001EDA55DE|nr:MULTISPECIES: pilus assembly protein TadG-related protein [unclassified Photobacterium]MCG2837857.1 pilus assembly protein TadG-related protein [Photobacterium sp. WH77]MCG2845475.1 pilus assembly protein TadG-related protein [Photobacterium sp. WH80]